MRYRRHLIGMLTAVAVIAATVLLVPTGRKLIIQTLGGPVGTVDLAAWAEVTGEREVTINAKWTWSRTNPRPYCDYVAVLGPAEWRTVETSASSGSAAEQSDGGTRIRELTGEPRTKTCVAVTPNLNGSVTIRCDTGAPATAGTPVTVLYMIADTYPVPPERWSAHAPTMIERFLTSIHAGAVTKISESSVTTTVAPWGLNIVIPAVDDAGYSPSVTYTTEPPAPEQVARDLFADYLRHYLSPDHPDPIRLSDSVISKIAIIDAAADGFRFGVDFDVKPVQLASGWLAGNGVLEFSGWIRGKHLQFDVIPNGGTFTVTGAGTGGR